MAKSAPAIDPTIAADGIREELARVGTPERAAGAKKYLKSDLEFLGVRTPDLRLVLKGWLRSCPGISRQDLLAVARELWSRPVFDLRNFAAALLVEQLELLAPDDLHLIERWLRESETWALVDHLSVHAAGPLVERHPELATELDRWAEDADFWVRRAAMLALLLPLRRGEGDWQRFTRYAETMLEEREFFIRKAIGWVLREVSKKSPERVRDFVAPRTDRISGVTLREAVKYLPADDREALLEAYRSR
ncbi:MAG: DNA alkylation repair protein [Thermoanaerobaculia bacterium]